MGGKIYNTKRTNTKEYLDISLDAKGKVSQFKNEVSIPDSFKNKISWGDVDCLTTLPLIDKEDILRVFNIPNENFSQNSNVYSILYRDFQVDIIHVPEEDFESSFEYYRGGDTGNLIGRLFHNIGLKFGHRGLLCPVKLSQEESLGEIVVSKNIRETLEFIVLDYEQWRCGFEDEPEMWEWISKSPYFNKSFYQLENLNHQNRKRNVVRPGYRRFLEWTNSREFDNNYIPSLNKTEHIWRAALHFGFDWINQAKPLIDEYRRDKEIRGIFNGSEVSKITSLTGAELGAILKSYKESLGDWKSFFYSRTKEEMIEHFKNWYDRHQI